MQWWEMAYFCSFRMATLEENLEKKHSSIQFETKGEEASLDRKITTGN